MTSATEIARLSNITASERAAELNAETAAWVAAGTDRWAGSLVEDQEHWGADATGLDLERSLLIGGFSDEYKEEHGIRPRWISFEGLTFSECEALVARHLPSREAAEEAPLDAEEAPEEDDGDEDALEAEMAALEALASRKGNARASRTR